MNDQEQAKAVERMQEYIVEHIQDAISLRQLAEAAGYSPWHSARIFKAYTGKTPFAYIRSLRLRYAAEVLRDQDVHVIDVAFDFLFSSHEGFTKAFAREFGITPKNYAKQTPPIPLFIPYSAYAQYEMKRKERNMKDAREVKRQGKAVVFVQIIQKEARKLLLKRGVKADHYFEYCKEVGCDVWGILSSVKEALGEPMGIWLPESMRRDGSSRYVQGVEVPANYQGSIPAGFELIELPAMDLMIFQGEPYDDSDFEEAIQDLWEVLERYNPAVVGYEWDGDDAYRFQLEPQGYRGYIEGKAVRKLR